MCRSLLRANGLRLCAWENEKRLLVSKWEQEEKFVWVNFDLSSSFICIVFPSQFYNKVQITAKNINTRVRPSATLCRVRMDSQLIRLYSACTLPYRLRFWRHSPAIFAKARINQKLKTICSQSQGISFSPETVSHDNRKCLSAINFRWRSPAHFLRFSLPWHRFFGPI